MARRTKVKVVVDDASRTALQRLVAAHKTPKDLARRARAVLLIADGSSFAAASRAIPMSKTHIRTWVARFLSGGLAGLNDLPRSGRPPVFFPRGRAASGPSGLLAARSARPVAVAVGLS